MRILLTGKNGQLGWELHRQLEPKYDIIALGRDDIDFRDSRLLFDLLKTIPEIDLVVNCAAYTDVDGAETHQFEAESVNSEAPALFATEADRRGIPIIHFSTDYVFNGQIWTRPYTEKDKPSPLSHYGWSKLAGEKRIQEITDRHLIFRTSGLYGARCRNFFTGMLARFRRRETPRVINDQVISPNWTSQMAEAVALAIDQILLDSIKPWGIYHLTGRGSTNWFEFARLIYEYAANVLGEEINEPTPTTSEEFGATAIRPKYSVLDPTKFNKTFQLAMPTWKEQFALFCGGLQINSNSRS